MNGSIDEKLKVFMFSFLKKTNKQRPLQQQQNLKIKKSTYWDQGVSDKGFWQLIHTHLSWHNAGIDQFDRSNKMAQFDGRAKNRTHIRYAWMTKLNASGKKKIVHQTVKQ